jgi:SAM-dependent methyltransferase
MGRTVDEVTARAENERRSYDEGRVFAASSALHNRFTHVFNCPNARHAEAWYREQLARRIRDAEVLELGCFDGASGLEYRAFGPRRYVGIDISGVQVEKARQRGIDARVMDAHTLDFPDASLDTVIGKAILHHLDYERALREIHRVLRPGGAAIFMEPLRDNPAFKLVRFLTPAARTADELPLSREQIEWADRLFGGSRHCFVGFASTAVGALTSFLPLAADNAALRLADRIDRRLERTALRYWMRMAVLVWEKT